MTRMRSPEDADLRRGATVVPSRHAAFGLKMLSDFDLLRKISLD
jgi:hypothetical protein